MARGTSGGGARGGACFIDGIRRTYSGRKINNDPVPAQEPPTVPAQVEYLRSKEADPAAHAPRRRYV